MTTPLRFGIIGTGVIARAFAEEVNAHARAARCVAVASRDPARASDFASRLGLPHAFAGAEALCACEEVEAVYIATPHTEHPAGVEAACRHGKAVLVEKPAGVTSRDAERIVALAREAGVFLMEAFKDRCHPQAGEIVRIVRSGVLGRVRRVEADFSFPNATPVDKRWRNPALGGGALLDLGCYAVEGVRLVASTLAGRDDTEPQEITGLADLGAHGADESAVALMRFGAEAGGLVGVATCSFEAFGGQRLAVCGDEARLMVDAFAFGPARTGGRHELRLVRKGEVCETITLEDRRPSLALEADAVSAWVQAGRTEAPWPAMTHADTLANARTLDRWRAAVGLRYPFE